MAGGIGITPIFSIVRHVSRRTDLRWSSYYCTRNADQTAFRTDLNALPTAKGKVSFHHSADPKPTPFEPWSSSRSRGKIVMSTAAVRPG